MAQDIGQDLETAGPTVSGIFGSNVSAGSSDLSSAFDLGTPTPLDFIAECKIVTGTGTPDGNEQCVISVAFSNDNTDFDDSTNETKVDSVKIGAASTTFIKNVRIFARARYCKIRAENDQSAGPDITTSSAITLSDAFIDQA